MTAEMQFANALLDKNNLNGIEADCIVGFLK